MECESFPTSPEPAVPPVYSLPDSTLRAETRTQVLRALEFGVSSTTVVDRVAQGLDAMVERHRTMDLPGEPKPACRARCSHCCHQRVEATWPEVLLIAKFLGKTEVPAGLAPLEVAAQSLRGLDSRTHHLRQIPCGLLDSTGACSIYSVRPLGCRRAHSTDAGICAAVHQVPNRKLLVPFAPILSWNLSAVVIGYYEGLVLAERPPHLYELNQALVLALTNIDPGLAEEQAPEWLSPSQVRRAEELPGLLAAPPR